MSKSLAHTIRVSKENDHSPESERWEADREEDAEEIGGYSAAGVETDGDLAPGEGEQHFG